MLKKPLYIDTDALDEYVASVEGGLRGATSRTKNSARSAGGGLGAGPARVSAEGSRGDEESVDYADHHAARLERLLQACEADPEGLAFIEVTQPNEEFSKAGFGALCAWECDIYQPEGIAALARVDELLPALEMMQTFGPMMRAFGEEPADMPDESQLSAMQAFIKNVDARPVVVGEDDDTEWRVVGSLDKRYVRPGARLEGRVRLLGKVAKKIPANRWHLLVDIPGMGLLSREERRRVSRDGPSAGEEGNYLKGPAVVLDVLTIYR